MLVVRHQHRGRAGAPDDLAHLLPEPLAHLDVEVREGLVEEQELGLRCERAGERDPLLLAARQLVRVLVRVAAQPHAFDQLGDSSPPLRHTVQAEADVLGDGEVREERVVLEHHADPALLRRDHDARSGNGPPVQQDLPVRHRLESRDAPEYGRLAAAARAEQAADRTALERERQTADDLEIVVGLAETAQLEERTLVAHIAMIIRISRPRKQESFLLESLARRGQ